MREEEGMGERGKGKGSWEKRTEGHCSVSKVLN